MARDPWARIARIVTKHTRRAVARADRAQDRRLHAKSQAQRRQDRQAAVLDQAFERGKASGAREANRLARVKSRLVAEE